MLGDHSSRRRSGPPRTLQPGSPASGCQSPSFPRAPGQDPDLAHGAGSGEATGVPTHAFHRSVLSIFLQKKVAKPRTASLNV